MAATTLKMRVRNQEMQVEKTSWDTMNMDKYIDFKKPLLRRRHMGSDAVEGRMLGQVWHAVPRVHWNCGRHNNEHDGLY
jgi:hypothetical protein